MPKTFCNKLHKLLANISSVSIAANVDSVHDLWLIGDEFLHESMSSLKSMQKSAEAKHTSLPFLYANFNVHIHYSKMAT